MASGYGVVVEVVCTGVNIITGVVVGVVGGVVVYVFRYQMLNREIYWKFKCKRDDVLIMYSWDIHPIKSNVFSWL